MFDILMEMRSVSRAADRLGLTQSAVSHALGRLRVQVDDPLFVRGRGGLRPTARAREMAPAVREGLALLRDAFSSSAFVPATAARSFTISASSYFCVTLLPIVIRRARDAAPFVEFRIVAPDDEIAVALDEGAIDLALGSFGRIPPRLVKTRLFDERLVWVGRADAGRELADRPRLTLTRGQIDPAMAEEMVNRGGLEYRTGMPPGPATLPAGPRYLSIHDPLSAGAFISSSDLVALMPAQLARLVTGRADIIVLDSASDAPLEISMLSHQRTDADPAHVWLRTLLDGAARALG